MVLEVSPHARQVRGHGDTDLSQRFGIADARTVQDGRAAFDGLHKVGLYGVLEQHAHRADRLDVGGGHRLAVARFRHDDAAEARPLAEALVGGGLTVLEVTLRTPAALDTLRAMKAVPGAIVGAGTVTSKRQLDAAIEAGAEFIVSPGLTDNLARSVIASGVPYLPGVATAGDIMRGLDLGLDRFKFFPATAAGGIPALKALAAPFGEVRF